MNTEQMMETEVIFDKLRAARQYLGMSQGDYAKAIGIGQNDISLLENGKRKFIPLEVLRFFAKKRILLNPLFDDNINPERFTELLSDNKREDTDCESERRHQNEIIQGLRETVQVQKITIDILRGIIDDNKKKVK